MVASQHLDEAEPGFLGMRREPRQQGPPSQREALVPAGLGGERDSEIIVDAARHLAIGVIQAIGGARVVRVDDFVPKP